MFSLMRIDIACVRNCKMLCGTRCTWELSITETAMKSCIFHTLDLLFFQRPVALESLVYLFVKYNPVRECRVLVCFNALSDDKFSHWMGLQFEIEFYCDHNSRRFHQSNVGTELPSTGGMWRFNVDISCWKAFSDMFMVTTIYRILRLGIELLNCTWVSWFFDSSHTRRFWHIMTHFNMWKCPTLNASALQRGQIELCREAKKRIFFFLMSQSTSEFNHLISRLLSLNEIKTHHSWWKHANIKFV